MIEILYGTLAFLILWVPAFILHELFHKLDAERQGCKARIKVWWHNGIPSMRCTVIEGTLTDKNSFYLAGGLGSGIVLMFISAILFPIPWLCIAIGTLGSINLIYAPYEMIFIQRLPLKDYMYYHWFVYGIGFVLSMVAFGWLYL